MDAEGGRAGQLHLASASRWRSTRCGITRCHPLRALAGRLGDAARAQRYGLLAAQTQTSFRARFWCAEGGYLYDVVDTPGARRDDPALRPNQIFAVSLSSGLLDAAQARAVVEVCQRELLTPVGLRSLARNDPHYMRDLRWRTTGA